LKHIRLSANLALFRDTCNVYVVRGPEGCLCIDFGSGAWLPALAALDWGPIRRVYLTHHHADQCAGLLSRASWPFEIHAPAAAKPLLSPQGVAAAAKLRRHGPVPPSYLLLERGLDQVLFDCNGWSDQFWGTRRLRFLSTPGHGPDGVSLLMDIDGRQVVFCGDAAHAGGVIWQPYHLEWDHWTASGAEAALQGVRRLQGLGIDLLCPSHGPVVRDRPRAMLATLRTRLQRFIEAKGPICPGEPDRYLEPIGMDAGWAQILPSLYHFGTNGYLLLSGTGEGFVYDPFSGDLPALDHLLSTLGPIRLTAMSASHVHRDHIDGVPALRRRGVKLWLHPTVAALLKDPAAIDMPWLPYEPILPDALLPRRGQWTWNEYTFHVAPFAGQTWWHCAMMTTIDGQRVFFGGDSFQPASRWNGTGGFCAYNACSFAGFIASSRLIRAWKPQIVANGHNTYHRFAASQYARIERWAKRAQQAVKNLCPGGDVARQYALHDVARPPRVRSSPRSS
jgi:glyoxylase-like metal-dependent hydrolase (beta-lactamase superfamily II)